MKSRKNKKYVKKYKKGGDLTNPNDCDIANLSTISTCNESLKKMNDNYQKCCPKDFIGRKNSSPYCKKLNNEYISQLKIKREIAGYHGDETDVAIIKQIMNEPHKEVDNNQLQIDKYNLFVKMNPNLLPATSVFEEINTIYPSISKNKNNRDEIEKEKTNAMDTLFIVPPEVGRYLQNPIGTLNITLNNNSETNLYYFLTQLLYFQKRDTHAEYNLLRRYNFKLFEIM